MAPLDGKLVLFGGFDDTNDVGDTLADTWTWDGAEWTQLDVTGPSTRAPAAMSSLNGKVVLVGGEGYVGKGEHETESEPQDTWTWDGSAWAQVTGPQPPSRGSSSMAPVDGKLVLAGGFTDFGALETCGEYKDTWSFDGSQWVQLGADLPEIEALAAMTALGSKLVLFSGTTVVPSDAGYAPCAEATDINETFVWDGATWMTVSRSAPPAYPGGVMATL